MITPCAALLSCNVWNCKTIPYLLVGCHHLPLSTQPDLPLQLVAGCRIPPSETLRRAPIVYGASRKGNGCRWGEKTMEEKLMYMLYVGWVFLVPGMGFSLPSTLFFLDLVFQFLPRVFSVPFGFFGSRRGCFRFPSKHGVSGSHLWVFSVPVFFLSVLVCYDMGASASVPFPSWVFSVPGGEGAAPPPQMLHWQRWWWSLFWTSCCCCCCSCCCCCCCCCCSCCSCCSLLFWILWRVLVLVVLVPWEEATLKNKKAGGGLGGRAQRLPPRCIADNDDGGLCLEPVVVVVVVAAAAAVVVVVVLVVVVVVVVVHCCFGYCGWYWCWWCWCRERRQP